MKKATHNPMGDTPDLDAAMCSFCGKELATLGVTGMFIGKGYPMGDKCYKKALKRGVDWNETTSLKNLKSLLRRGTVA